MKLIIMFSKREYVVDDDEAENVAIASQGDGMICLRSGDFINPKGIESIGEVPKVMMYKGYFVEKDGMSYYRDGERIRIEHPDNRVLVPRQEYQDQINRIKDNRLKADETKMLEEVPHDEKVKSFIGEMKSVIGRPMITDEERTAMMEERAMQDRGSSYNQFL